MYYVTKSMVETFVAYSKSEEPDIDFPDYNVPEVIKEWPGNGPSSDQYDRYLDPFKDHNGNGQYEPMTDGEYP